MRNKITSKHIARMGLIAGLYVAVTFLLSAISFGPVQVRISEALTLLPIIYPEAITGLSWVVSLPTCSGLTVR